MKSTIYTNNFSTYKSGSIAQQPDQSAHQFLRFTESFERSAPDHRFTACGETAILVGQQPAVLMGDKKTRSNGIHANLSAVSVGSFHAHKSRVIIYRCFSH